jgi:hypothetical protein
MRWRPGRELETDIVIYAMLDMISFGVAAFFGRNFNDDGYPRTRWRQVRWGHTNTRDGPISFWSSGITEARVNRGKEDLQLPFSK